MVEMTTRTPEPWLDGSARRSEARDGGQGVVPVPGSICPRLLPRTGVAAITGKARLPLMRWRRILALRHPTPDAPCAARHCRPDQWRDATRRPSWTRGLRACHALSPRSLVPVLSATRQGITQW